MSGVTAADVLQALRDRGLTAGTAESCTGGLVAGELTSVPGSSDVVLGGVVSYAFSVKERLLGVPAEELDAHGAVTETCARLMAAGAKEAIGCDVAISVTGIAGPGGEEPGKPVGTVWLAVDAPGLVRAERHWFPGGRDEVRRQAVVAALELVMSAVRAIQS
ncbi:CinA family protein [Olsenella sp. YH-ols2217]|uniref:CinA family protein n=1 Tax=Kribbibacterium absianum TaxID=3044210 RepID=A0ABT6ZIV1_9ACTN|nr:MULTISPECIES: CinA family protein [unclassified Olsenella]MDJ1121490.1 CinA family protein [Olsenella sp. YH-ols2216]MDJ1128980.1 CinA family protein [Olsenella sp. YH-ols2217]